MPFPQLSRYLGTPFNAGTKVSLIDKFIGDGVNSIFGPLVNKPGTEVGSSVQVDNVLFPRFNGAAIVDGDDIVLSSIPLAGQEILIPGTNHIVFPASDQNDALGRIYETSAFLADVETIQNFIYKAQPGNSGIKLQFVNKLALDGADASWFQLAPANPDGSVGVYLGAGLPLYTPNIEAADNLASGVLSGASTFDVADGSQFTAGDYVMLDQGQVTQEIVKIASISMNTITIFSSLSFSHSMGAGVLTVGRKFWMKMTVPLNITGGTAMNFYGVTLDTVVRAALR